jgi:hypothetical protein
MRRGVRPLPGSMRRFHGAAAATLAALLPVLLCVSATEAEALPVSVLDESAQDPPVVIVSAAARVVDNGTRYPDFYFLTTVSLQNFTYKPVEAVRIQWDLYSVAGAYLGNYAEDLREESAGAPLLTGGAVRSVLWNRNHTYTNVARAAVAVTGVRFQDGTRWRLRRLGQAAEGIGP